MADCHTCKANREPDSVPYIVHESANARVERKEKRLIGVIVLLIVLLVVSNTGWMYYENQFEDVKTTNEVTQEAENGTNNFVGGDMNGETNHPNNNN